MPPKHRIVPGIRYIRFPLPAVQPSEREAPASLRHDSLHVHRGRPEEALPPDARAHEAAQRAVGLGRDIQDQVGVRGP